MKKFLMVVMFLTMSVAYADYQVKTVDGYYDVRSNSSRHYVCYRARIIDNNTGNLMYVGCARYRNSCASNNKVHFGKYPSNNAARRALRRCQYSNPRFID